MTQLLCFMVEQFNFPCHLLPLRFGSLRYGKRFDEMGSKPLEFLALALGYDQGGAGREGLCKVELKEVIAIDP